MHQQIVLDANILVRAVLGVRVADLLKRYAERVSFFAPQIAFDDASRHLPAIAAKRGVDSTLLLDSLAHLHTVVEAISPNLTDLWKEEAVARIGTRDMMDWPIVAAALALDCPIWTEDRDFFGTGVAVWTTERIEIFLSRADSH